MSEKIIRFIRYGRTKVGAMQIANEIHTKFPKFSNRVTKVIDWSERNPIKAAAIFPAKFTVKLLILYYAGKYVSDKNNSM